MEAGTLIKMKQLAGISRNQGIRDASYTTLLIERTQESIPYENQLNRNVYLGQLSTSICVAQPCPLDVSQVQFNGVGALLNKNFCVDMMNNGNR
ncbi:MAG: hypothetical protein EBT86_00990 [Actinobacteria bacterium]|nr:hypothetical protein [Actinomycetota bacterium]NDG26834.1 hypothetical protein [Pseudomonadota bacterium]